MGLRQRPAPCDLLGPSFRWEDLGCERSPGEPGLDPAERRGLVAEGRFLSTRSRIRAALRPGIHALRVEGRRTAYSPSTTNTVSSKASPVVKDVQ